MKAQERLQAAREASRAGRYEEALSEFMWFHNHALEEEPALYGVRLSFALFYWVELAQVYPTALRALQQVRDQKTSLLLSGAGDRHVFHDVEAINEALHQVGETHRLFKELERVNPGLALQCSDLATPALVSVGDYEAAARYILDPKERVTQLSKTLCEDIADIEERPRSKSPCHQAFLQIYADELSQLVVILAGTGRSDEAASVKALALSLLKPIHVRKAVEAKLAEQA